MKSLLAAVTLSLMAMAVPASAQMTMKTPAEFVKTATVSNMFEIKSSQLALQKSKTPEVRAFAEQMIADHTKAAQELTSTLPQSSVPPAAAPKTLDEAHQTVYDKLAGMEGMDFDKHYINAQMDAHKMAVSLFRNYSNDGEDKALKAFAGKTLPTLEMHLKHVTHLHESSMNDKHNK